MLTGTLQIVIDIPCDVKDEVELDELIASIKQELRQKYPSATVEEGNWCVEETDDDSDKE
jgi:hypothetical protein